MPGNTPENPRQDCRRILGIRGRRCDEGPVLRPERPGVGGSRGQLIRSVTIQRQPPTRVRKSLAGCRFGIEEIAGKFPGLRSGLRWWLPKVPVAELPGTILGAGASRSDNTDV